MSGTKVKKDVLFERFKSLGWSKSELARRVAEVRLRLYGDNIEDPNSLINGLTGALEHPEKSSGKIIESLVIAMGGALDITWTVERVVRETEKIRLSENTE